MFHNLQYCKAFCMWWAQTKYPASFASQSLSSFGKKVEEFVGMSHDGSVAAVVLAAAAAVAPLVGFDIFRVFSYPGN
jgi:hypothetical protein